MKISLEYKAIVVVVVFTVILSASVVFISYNTYVNNFRKYYVELARAISESTATLIDDKKVKGLVDEVQERYKKVCAVGGNRGYDSDYNRSENYRKHFEYIKGMPEYIELSEKLNVLATNRTDNEEKSLYVGFVDIETMKYVYVADEGSIDPCVPGDYDDISEVNVQKIKEGLYEPSTSIDYYLNLGWICSASTPLRDEKGSVIGIVFVDISMNKMVESTHYFLMNLLIVTTIFSLILARTVLYLINRGLIKPLNHLNSAAKAFVSEKKEGFASENSQIIQLNIKTGDEIEALSESIKKMGEDINTYISELTLVTSEKERIGAELDIAANIQASMLPCTFLERREFDIYAEMSAAKEVGGDFYDFFMVDDRHIAIVMADVSGKGVPAAMFMVIAKTLIKYHTSLDTDLGEVFTKVNNILCESNSEGLFVTAFEGILDLLTGDFTFVNAGHEIPYIYRKGKVFEPYKIKPGFVLAGMEDMKYSSGKLKLEEGDKLFQYTDGVTEAVNSKNEFYGSKRLEYALNKAAHDKPDEIIAYLKKEIAEFVGETEQFDDITMLCLEYKHVMEAEV